MTPLPRSALRALFLLACVAACAAGPAGRISNVPPAANDWSTTYRGSGWVQVNLRSRIDADLVLRITERSTGRILAQVGLCDGCDEIIQLPRGLVDSVVQLASEPARRRQGPSLYLFADMRHLQWHLLPENFSYVEAPRLPAPAPLVRADMISNAETGNAGNFIEHRGGYWYAFVDEVGSTLWPPATHLKGIFQMAKGGAAGTEHAMRMTGRLAQRQDVFAGVGLNLQYDKLPYNASRCDGIAFWARKGSGSTGQVRLEMPDWQTEPDGKVCDVCFNHFGMDIALTDAWQEHSVPFSSMRQLPGHGDQFPRGIDSSKLFGVMFSVTQPGASFDVWVDEVRFAGCK